MEKKNGKLFTASQIEWEIRRPDPNLKMDERFEDKFRKIGLHETGNSDRGAETERAREREREWIPELEGAERQRTGRRRREEKAKQRSGGGRGEIEMWGGVEGQIKGRGGVYMEEGKVMVVRLCLGGWRSGVE